MKYLAFLLLFVITGYNCSKSDVKIATNTKITGMDSVINIHNISVKTMAGEDKKLSDYKGKVVLIVNVASQCGYTPQYKSLQALYEKYKSAGFEILAFPCNDFGSQEPGTNEEIKQFCESKYNVTFTLFDKIKVLSNERSPLYAKLINYEPAGDISWNFEKFVVDKNGNVVSRFKSKVKPDDTELISVIEKELLK